MVKLGFSTSALPRAYWNLKLKDIPLKTVEINLDHSSFSYEESVIKEKILPQLSGYDISFHSRAKNLFHPNKLVADAERALIKVDLWLAEIAKVREVVFHISKKAENVDFEFLKKVASNFNGELLIENNSRGRYSSEEEIVNVLETVPDLGFCLDVGHLLIAERRGLISDKFDFVDALKNKVSYVHIHGNRGKVDTHSVFELNDENIEILKILRKIKPDKIIIETRTTKELFETLKRIKGFF